MAVELVPATQAAVARVAQRLRAADLAEVEAVHGAGCDPVRVLLVSAGQSAQPLVARLDGEPIAVLGCAVGGTLIRGRFGSPWLLGTDACHRQGRALVVLGRILAEHWHARHGPLRNRVDARNAPSLRWLRRLGFEIHSPEPFGVQQRPFHLFTMG